jgi:hypothetical protein
VHLKIPIPVTGRLLRLMPCACIARSLLTVDHINDMGKLKRAVFYSSWVFLIQFLNGESNKSISMMWPKKDTILKRLIALKP